MPHAITSLSKTLQLQLFLYKSFSSGPSGFSTLDSLRPVMHLLPLYSSRVKVCWTRSMLWITFHTEKEYCWVQCETLIDYQGCGLQFKSAWLITYIFITLKLSGCRWRCAVFQKCVLVKVRRSQVIWVKLWSFRTMILRNCKRSRITRWILIRSISWLFWLFNF